MRLHIITIARELFSAKLISDVSVTDICDACSIERKTFYRYYSGKERVAFEIRMCVLLDLLDFQSKNFIYDERINAYANFEHYINQIYGISLVTDIDKFRKYYKFLSHFDYMTYGLTTYNPNEEDLFSWIRKINVTTVKDLLQRGVTDGSINLHNNTPQETSLIFMNSFSSMILRGFLVETESRPFNANQVIHGMKLMLYGIKK